MCHDHDASPPPPAHAEVSYRATDLVLRASDGTEFGAFEAAPDLAAPVRVLILPDIGGLSDFYRRLAGHLAGFGCRTLVIDWFGRTAGPAPRSTGLDHDEWQFALRREELLLDVQAGLDHFPGTGARVAVGFCIGGGTALHAAAEGLAVDGVAALYPWTGSWPGVPALPDDFVAAIRCPVLALFGGADRVVPAGTAAAISGHLPRSSEVAVYEGQPHGYFEKDLRAEAGHEEAAADSWERLRAFLRRVGAGDRQAAPRLAE